MLSSSLAMIMVQKLVHLLSSPSTYYRRHPSAPPTVLVQPTRIPGLLSYQNPKQSFSLTLSNNTRITVAVNPAHPSASQNRPILPVRYIHSLPRTYASLPRQLDLQQSHTPFPSLRPLPPRGLHVAVRARNKARTSQSLGKLFAFNDDHGNP